MERTEIVSLFKNTPADGTEITVCGWAKNIRDSKNIGFIALSDGGCFKTLQVVLEAGKLANYDEVIHTGLYSSLRVKGKLVLTPQAKQPFELNADSVEILGDCPADEYPLQKKKMSMEYLRTMPTLRPRTNTFNAASACAAPLPTPSTSSSRRTASFTLTLRCSPLPTVRAQARCSA